MNITKISIKTVLLYLLVLLLVSDSLLKYYGVDWTINEWGTGASMLGKVIIPLKYAQIAVLISLVIVIKKIKQSVMSLSGVLLIALGLFWCVQDFRGAELIYLNSAPFILVEFGLMFIIVQDRDAQTLFLRLCPALAVVYTFLCSVLTVSFRINHPTLRMADGNIIEYFAFGLFLIAICASILPSTKKQIIINYVCSVILVFCGVVTTSRGWMIQALLLLIVIYYTSSDKSTKSKLRNILVALAVLGIIYYFITVKLYDAASFIIDRFNESTRLGQLQTFFDQVSIKQLIVGQGFSASYFYRGTQYAYIDNQFLFWMFRYGVLTVISYLIPFVCCLLRKSNHNEKKWFFRNYMIIAWLLNMGGLGIYYSLKVDIAHLFILTSIAYSLYCRPLNVNKELTHK